MPRLRLALRGGLRHLLLTRLFALRRFGLMLGSGLGLLLLSSLRRLRLLLLTALLGGLRLLALLLLVGELLLMTRI